VDGRSLGAWIEEFANAHLHPEIDPRPGDRIRRAEEAILKIGDRGIPTLLHQVRSRDSRLHQRLLEYLQQHPKIPLKLPSAEHHHTQASWGFTALREKGRVAVPDLVESLSDPDPGVRETAAWCLGHIGPDAESAIPAMLTLLTLRHRDRTVLAAMHGLHGIGRRQDLVVPALIPFIRADRDGARYFNSAVFVLGAFGTNAAAASPALQTFLRTNTVSGYSSAALRALESIDYPAAKRHWAEHR
jgi:HEAT repeat protein